MVGWLVGWLDGLPVFIHLGVGTRADSLQEWFIRDETIIVFGVTAFLDENVDLLTLQLLTQGEEDVLQLTQHHCAVLHLVVKLKALDEVLVGSGVLGLLHLAVDRVELLQLDELLALLLGAAQFVDHLESGVEVQAPETVAEVEEVHPGLALKVVDVKGKLCSLNLLVVQIMSHGC